MLGQQWLDLNVRYGGWGWLGWVLTAVAVVVFVALVIAAVILVVRSSLDGRREPGSTEIQRGPRHVRDRYARGEIDDEEFRRRVATCTRAPVMTVHGSRPGVAWLSRAPVPNWKTCAGGALERGWDGSAPALAALGALGAGSVLGLGSVLRGIFDPPQQAPPYKRGGCMGWSVWRT